MKIYNLREAAHFLKLNPEVVRKRAFKGDIPASKKTGRWLFVEVDLIEWLREDYKDPTLCSTNGNKPVITIQTLHCTENEYTAALGRKASH